MIWRQPIELYEQKENSPSSVATGAHERHTASKSTLNGSSNQTALIVKNCHRDLFASSTLLFFILPASS